MANHNNYDEVVKQAESAFRNASLRPAPWRGKIVRQIGEALKHKTGLGKLVSYEMERSLQEGLGEVTGDD